MLLAFVLVILEHPALSADDLKRAKALILCFAVFFFGTLIVTLTESLVVCARAPSLFRSFDRDLFGYASYYRRAGAIGV